MNQGRGLLAGRRALVTGAATGIGRAIAEAFVSEGARVAVTDIGLDGARDVAERLGGGTRAYRLDVTDAAETAEVFRSAADWMGGLDLLAANAGISTMNAVVDLTEEEWDSNMAVNAKGVFLSNREAVRHFLAAGEKGAIVNTASLAGKIGAPLLAHYAASKFAVVGFTQSLAREVGEHGIRVNAVCPGYVRTSMQDRELVWEGKLRGMTPGAVRDEYVAATPLGRLEEPEDVAAIVVFLASDLSGFLTGEAINASGGVLMD
ncbi:MAG: SDR family NAD(P)-dependent oxidoreductase [Rhodospirillales bacterium]|nr:SDR family NAD(P)-dependent oxidoreductase [Rhodospirillales bacterium]